MDSVTIKAFLSSLPPAQRRIVKALRTLVRRTVPDAVESFLWGGLSYHRPDVGGRVKGAVCQIVVKRGTIRLDFIHGIRLTDRARLLHGEGKSKRHVAIADAAAARNPQLVRLIKEAAKQSPAGSSPRTAR
jgi:hypothetical protein